MNGGTTNQAGPDTFQPITMLPGHLIPAAQQLSKFSGRHFTTGEGGSHFDWPGFKDDIQRSTKGDLSFDGYAQSTIHQQDGKVDKMANRVASFLQDALPASIDVKELKKIVRTTFLRLSEEIESTQSGSSAKSSRKGHFSWEYGILLPVPFGSSSPEYFYSLVATMKITADIQGESFFRILSWLLKNFSVPIDAQNFSVKIDALRLIVRSDFRDPEPAKWIEKGCKHLASGCSICHVYSPPGTTTPEISGPLIRYVGKDCILLAPPRYEIIQ